MTDETPTTERTPRAPFADVPVRDVVRDVVAVIALLVGLALPWTATERGSDRLEVVLTTVLAVAAIALPYARRAQLFTGSWAADERRVRLVGLAPVSVVAVLYVLFDVLPGVTVGVGAGLGLSLAGAVLAAELPWRRDVPVVAGLIALGAVAAPIVMALELPVELSGVLALAVAALLVLALLWLTAGRYARGDEAAGVLLVALGIVLAAGAALVGGAEGAHWIDSVHGPSFGFTVLPVLAAVAVPHVVGQKVAADAQPRLWADVAVKALEVGILLGAYIAVMAVIVLSSSNPNPDTVETVVRLILGLVVAVTLFLARRALRADLVAGHATAVGASVIAAVLGCVLLVVGAGIGTATSPADWLLAFGAPATVLAVLLVPRSLRELREQTPAPGVPEAGAVELQQAPAPAVRSYPPAMAGASGGVTMNATAGETTIMEPVGAPAATPVDPAPAVTPADAASADPAPTAGPRAAEAIQQVGPDTAPPATGPFGVVGATEVMPAISDAPTASGWSVSQALDPATPLADLAQIAAQAPELRRYVAANPSTYPALLDWLGALGDPEVDAALRTRR